MSPRIAAPDEEVVPVIGTRLHVQEDADPAPGKVCIGFLSGSEVAGAFLVSMLEMTRADHQQGWNRLDHPNWFIWQRSGANVSLGRNRLVRKFLAMRDPAPEWLFMVDTDMVFNPTALENLMIQAEWPDRSVIGGLCFAFGRDPDSKDPTSTAVMSTVFQPADPLPGCGIPTFRIVKPREVPKKTLLQVYGTGAAFLLIHRQVLVDVWGRHGGTYPWFTEAVDPDTRTDVPPSEREDYWVSEDLHFCFKVQQAGYEVFIHTGVEVRHIKPVALDERLWRQFSKAVTFA